MCSRPRTWGCSCGKLAPFLTAPKYSPRKDREDAPEEPDYGATIGRYSRPTRRLPNQCRMGTCCRSRGWRTRLRVESEPCSGSESALETAMDDDRSRWLLTRQAPPHIRT